jgi:hypothetical protein
MYIRCFGSFMIGLTAVLMTQPVPLGLWGTASSATLGIGMSTFDTKGTLYNAWLANAPQLLLSMCYLTFNGLCTNMALSYEWNQFAVHRKGLRVTKPEGEQRSTYFLQIPFKWGLPLTGVSCLLHWLMSQSMFFVRIDVQSREGMSIVERSRNACGFSRLSLMVLVMAIALLIFVVTSFALIRLRERIPFAAACSLVVSAACHPSPEEVDPAIKPVKWGVLEIAGIQHCTFSSEAVIKPKPGQIYS